MHPVTNCDDMIHRLSAFLVPAFLAAPLAAQDRAASYSVEKELNLVYNAARDADPVKHKLDFFVPKGAKDYPVMMFVHGGSWKSGDKDRYTALGENFARQGIGTAIINYRLSNGKGTVRHPDHIKDVAKAFSWVKENAKKYGGNRDKLFVAGHSAGGHLVSLLATDESYLKAEKCTVKDIRGVVAVSGVYTISNLVPLFHDPFGKDPEVCKAASPMNHVNGKHPPFLIAYGTKDLPLLDTMAEQFGRKLQDCKCEAKLMKLERDHISIVVEMGTKADDPLTRAMVEFIKK
jgi:acetyl esterase/lipase